VLPRRVIRHCPRQVREKRIELGRRDQINRLRQIVIG
jgi:hypothetical protein